jgi:hypothetical protein
MVKVEFKEWLLLSESQSKFVNYLGIETYTNDNNIYLKYSTDPKGNLPFLSEPIIKIKHISSGNIGRLEPTQLGGWYEIITGKEYDRGHIEITDTFKVFMPNEDANEAISLLSYKKRRTA